jgi:hypothetical protein
MAVPSSGTLSMYNLAREKHHDDYSSNQNILIPISMYDLVNGGDTNGSGVDYEVTNQASSPKPDSTAPHAMSEWYGYDHDGAVLGGNGTNWNSAPYYASGNIYYNSNGTSALGHTSKANACNDTTTQGTCSFIMWRGTLGNGTTMYWNYGNTSLPLEVLDGTSNSVFVRPYSTWSNLTISNGSATYNGQSTGNDVVFQVNSSGVVSNFGSCVTLTGLDVTSTTYPKPVFACGQTDTTTRYFSDTAANITVNSTVVYTTSAGTTTLSAGNYGLNLLHSSTNNRFTVNSSGVITAYASC